jgi:prevent-host-death family protein
MPDYGAAPCSPPKSRGGQNLRDWALLSGAQGHASLIADQSQTRIEVVELKQVGVYDAKTQLPRLLEQVERGETVTITRHGRPVAKLVPVGRSGRSVDETIAAIREARKSHRLDGVTVRELIDEGRRR